MDTQFLVREHIDIGRRLMERVRSAHGVDIVAAFWLKDEELGFWRLIFISPDVTVEGKGPIWAYAMIGSAVYDVENDPESYTKVNPEALAAVYDVVSVLSPATRIFIDLQRALTASGRSELRNSKLRDAYVYEMTAAPEPVAR
ncbi:MAG: hypothetical protein U0Q16_05880 [Bryobacteraceae bacterium]